MDTSWYLRVRSRRGRGVVRAGGGAQAQLLRQGARGAPVVGAGLATILAAVVVAAATAAAGVAAGDAIHRQTSQRLQGCMDDVRQAR